MRNLQAAKNEEQTLAGFSAGALYFGGTGELSDAR
jgi:hypothetical protein